MILATTAIFSQTLLLFLVLPAAVFADQPRNGACRDNREEFGFALVGHDYKTVHADNFGRCFFECSSGERCQSVTFLWNTKECQFKKETKKSRPESFEENPAATYMENNFRAKKGSKALVPGSSCKDILISGDAQGDGEYWTDPTASGDPFTVFCDMTTDGGGWILITRILRTVNSALDETVKSNSYKTVLAKYNSDRHYLLRDGFNQLKQDIGFTQTRFYCFKKTTGRVFHIMTNKNAKGANVVKFFTTSDTMPVVCSSFTRLPDDNSLLAKNCDKWGYSTKNRWGHNSFVNDERLLTRPIAWAYTRFYRLTGNVLQCDDILSNLSVGDIWQIFVR